MAFELEAARAQRRYRACREARQSPGTPAESLGDAVFERMERDDREPSAQPQQQFRSGSFCQFFKFAVHMDT
jgi:hypothetical protein